MCLEWAHSPHQRTGRSFVFLKACVDLWFMARKDCKFPLGIYFFIAVLLAVISWHLAGLVGFLTAKYWDGFSTQCLGVELRLRCGVRVAHHRLIYASIYKLLLPNHVLPNNRLSRKLYFIVSTPIGKTLCCTLLRDNDWAYNDHIVGVTFSEFASVNLLVVLLWKRLIYLVLGLQKFYHACRASFRLLCCVVWRNTAASTTVFTKLVLLIIFEWLLRWEGYHILVVYV